MTEPENLRNGDNERETEKEWGDSDRETQRDRDPETGR